MKFYYEEGDLLENPNINYIVHQCNCFHTMGSGIAKFIREKFPEAYEADLKTKKGAFEKTGSISIGFHEPTKQHIVNCYSQYRYLPRGEKHTNYEWFNDCMVALKKVIKSQLKKDEIVTVGFPYKIGSDLGGGDWEVMREIIRSNFKEEQQIKIFIIYLPYYKNDLSLINEILIENVRRN